MSTIETLTKERDELLSRVKYLDEVREFNETSINGLSCKLNAANARCEQLRSELEAARGKVEALTAHVTVLTASLRATGVPQTLLDRMLADATHNP